jgi:hypothetical protein
MRTTALAASVFAITERCWYLSCDVVSWCVVMHVLVIDVDVVDDVDDVDSVGGWRMLFIYYGRNREQNESI